MSDSLADYEMAPSMMHRCLPPRRPRIGDRYDCLDCGMRYVYLDGPFPGWQPTSAPEAPDPPVARHIRGSGRNGRQLGGNRARQDG